ncbi:MAG: gliding motility-associated C-terminal domain-containing protein [Bacteroidota bacterium]|nr:gliding motility-associated C-terminal domain-containing protein [Bacteroidota bacterium]
MCRRRYLLLFLFITFSFKAFSAVFVVTSNADSGPGTLREALTLAAANGSAEKDYINFNLPDLSEAGRTIMLTTQLPDVSSNLVIDASTQPGEKFGVSDARIGLFFQTPVEQSLSGLSVINQHDVEIYGLYIKNLTDVTASQTLYFWKGIELKNDKNIQVGATGKGNVLSGFYESLVVNFPENEPDFFENLTLKDNFFGVDADGEMLSVNEVTPVSIYFIIGQINIGGTVSEGNLFTQGLSIYQGNMNDYNDPNDYSSMPADFLIKNNNIGVDYYLQRAIPKSNGLGLATVDPGGKNTCHIEDNVIASENNYAINIGNNGRPVFILRNYIGTDKTRTKVFNTLGLFFYWATAVAVGSNDPADANYITNCNPISIWPYANATVNKNSIYCTVNASARMHFDAWNEFNYPIVKILNISPNSVSGTATANSAIELFYSDVCQTCSPQTYFASVVADNNGKWEYNGNITGTIIASATINGNTSEFTRTTINTDSVKIINACNNDGLGSIIGAVPNSAKVVKWVDEHGTLVGSKADLINVKIGKYKLIAQNGGCSDSTAYFEIKSILMVDTSNISRKQPSCGQANGAIIGIYIQSNDPGPTNLDWKNETDKVVSRSSYLQSVPAGTYRLIISNADSSCSYVYGPVTLKNTTGPNIDQSPAKIRSTNCGQSTGSITNLNITGTGTLKYTWLNSQQQQVGTDKDLLNQPAGTYKLQVTDDTQCGPVYTSDIEIPETNGVVLDESKYTKTTASCGKSNGSITGITENGATAFVWTDAAGRIAGNAVDLTNVPSGDYTLTVSNAFGCSKTSAVYHIDQQAPTIFLEYGFAVNEACFGSPDGSITISPNALVKSLRWVNSAGVDVGSQTVLPDLSAGDYQLYLTDAYGCESFYKTYTVNQTPEYKVAEYGVVTADACNTGTGTVSATTITGGLPPYTYTWYNADRKPIGSASSITNLAAGVYTLNVVDTRCGNVDITYTVGEETNIVSTPSVSDIQLCSNGNALIMVNDADANSLYRIYDDASASGPIAEQKGGKFTVQVNSSRSYFISKIKGTCESARIEVKVTVGLSVVNIANTFTPNGDGINDYWKINNIENYPGAVVQVFTRYGQKVFESKGYGTPFNGTFNGKKLAAGVYYFIINLNSNCNILSGSLTLIR